MNSDLIVVTFDDEDEALKVLEAMQAMRREPLLSLHHAVAVTRDQTSKIKLHQTRDLTPGGEVAGDDVLDLLAGLIFGRPLGFVWGIAVDETIDEMVRYGFDGKFVQAIEQTVGNNASAILFLVRREGGNDVNEILQVLSLFKGKIHQTTLSPEVEAFLEQMMA